MKGINYYSILHLKRHCTEDDIHEAFGKLASKYLIANQTQDCNLINLCEAYEVLSKPLSRALYDQYGEDGIKKGVQSNTLYIGPWIYHGDVIYTYSEYCALKNPISCLFIKPSSSVDINFKKFKSNLERVKLPLKLTLNEIFHGTVKLINVKKKLVHISDSILNKVQVVKVKVPPGFPTGGTLKSEVLKASTELGDLKVEHEFTVEEIPHKIFKRDNMNLIMVENVSLKQVLFGVKINVKTLDHKILRVNITQVITDDYVKEIQNEGLPSMNDPTKRGAIVIKFDITYPLYMSVTDELCDLLGNSKINKI